MSRNSRVITMKVPNIYQKDEELIRHIWDPTTACTQIVTKAAPSNNATLHISSSIKCTNTNKCILQSTSETLVASGSPSVKVPSKPEIGFTKVEFSQGDTSSSFRDLFNRSISKKFEAPSKFEGVMFQKKPELGEREKTVQRYSDDESSEGDFIYIHPKVHPDDYSNLSFE